MPGRGSRTSCVGMHSPRDPSSTRVEEVEGRLLAVSHPEKVLWPSAGFTKGQMIDYYLAVARMMLPHLKERPLTLKRAPDGVDGWWWYQTRCPHPPEWVRTIEVPAARGDGVWDYCVAGDAATLVWLANLGCIEFHPLFFRGHKITEPTLLIFDLDPGPPAGVLECGEVALTLRERLARLSLSAFVKSSGLTGLHVYVPLTGGYEFDQTKEYAHRIARQLADDASDLVTDRRSKAARLGKVLIDWRQNDRFKSVVAPYSLRVAPLPLVSTPVTWDEVETAVEHAEPDRLMLLATDVMDRIRRGVDPWASALEVEQSLGTGT